MGNLGNLHTTRTQRNVMRVSFIIGQAVAWAFILVPFFY